MYDAYVYGYVFVYLYISTYGACHTRVSQHLEYSEFVCTCLYVYAYVHVCVYCMCTYNYWISPIMYIVDGLQSLVGEMSSVLTPYSVPTAQPMVWPNLRSASCFSIQLLHAAGRFRCPCRWLSEGMKIYGLRGFGFASSHQTFEYL